MSGSGLFHFVGADEVGTSFAPYAFGTDETTEYPRGTCTRGMTSGPYAAPGTEARSCASVPGGKCMVNLYYFFLSPLRYGRDDRPVVPTFLEGRF